MCEWQINDEQTDDAIWHTHQVVTHTHSHAHAQLLGYTQCNSYCGLIGCIVCAIAVCLMRIYALYTTHYAINTEKFQKSFVCSTVFRTFSLLVLLKCLTLKFMNVQIFSRLVNCKWFLFKFPVIVAQTVVAFIQFNHIWISIVFKRVT